MHAQGGGGGGGGGGVGGLEKEKRGREVMLMLHTVLEIVETATLSCHKRYPDTERKP